MKKLFIIIIAIFISIVEVHGTSDDDEDEEDEVKYACEQDWVRFKDSCYQVSRDQWLDFNNSRIVCHKVGAELPSIHDEDENSFLTGLLYDNVTVIDGADSNAFIGLYSVVEGPNFNWRWTDESAVNFLKFNKVDFKQYNYERCGQIRYEVGNKPWHGRIRGEWNNFNCSAIVRDGVCQKKMYEVEETMYTTTLYPVTGNETEELDNATLLPVFYACHKGWHQFHSSRYCYKVVRGQWLDFPHSREVCQMDGADLASVHNEEQNIFLTLILRSGVLGDKEPQNHTAYIGLESLTNGPYFDWRWTDDTHVDYLNLRPIEFDDAQKCGHLRYETSTEGFPSAYWDQYYCYHRVRDGLCEKKHLSRFHHVEYGCEPGWEQYKDSCYRVNRNRRGNAFMHERDCFSMGAELVSIHHADENGFVIRFLRSHKVHNDTFIGFWATPKNSINFVWSDKSKEDFIKFAPGEPVNRGSNCVVIMIKTGEWMVHHCFKQLPHGLCKKKLVPFGQ